MGASPARVLSRATGVSRIAAVAWPAAQPRRCLSSFPAASAALRIAMVAGRSRRAVGGYGLLFASQPPYRVAVIVYGCKGGAADIGIVVVVTRLVVLAMLLPMLA